MAPGAAVVLALATAKGVVHCDRHVLTDRYRLFALRRLVDIAERALSPGVNDPGTGAREPR